MSLLVRVPICEDGRSPDDRTTFQHEADYFTKLYHDFNELNMPDLEVHAYGYVYVYICIHIIILYIYMYLYIIYRERDRVK